MAQQIVGKGFRGAISNTSFLVQTGPTGTTAFIADHKNLGPKVPLIKRGDNANMENARGKWYDEGGNVGLGMTA